MAEQDPRHDLRARPGDNGEPWTTLPAWVYDNQELYELELEEIFYPGWHIVCHISDVPHVGSYITFDLGSEHCVVVRGRDKQLRAFHNVCRHRAHPLVSRKQGKCRGRLTCPYHGWTYGLDGELRIVPADESFPDMDKADYGLESVELDTLFGFVFVRFRPGGPDLATWAGIDPKLVAPYRLEEVKPYRKIWAKPLGADWKNAMDNYQESYHVPAGHPGLNDLVEQPDGGDLKISRERSKRWSVGLYQSLLPEFPHLPAELQRTWRLMTLLPNMAFDIYPDMMDFFQILPAGPGKCIIRSGAYCLDDDRREVKAARWLNERINAEVQEEDNEITLAVQRGLRSSSYNVGLLSTKEVWLKEFQDLVRAKVPVTRLEEPPEPGTMWSLNATLAAL